MFQDEPDVDDGVEGQRRDVSSTPASGAVKKILLVLDPPSLFLPLAVLELVHLNEELLRKDGLDGGEDIDRQALVGQLVTGWALSGERRERGPGKRVHPVGHHVVDVHLLERCAVVALSDVGVVVVSRRVSEDEIRTSDAPTLELALGKFASSPAERKSTSLIPRRDSNPLLSCTRLRPLKDTRPTELQHHGKIS